MSRKAQRSFSNILLKKALTIASAIARTSSEGICTERRRIGTVASVPNKTVLTAMLIGD